jgi:hypothetical protein
VTHDDVTPAPNTEQDDAALSHDAIGAYILGALPDDERIVFEAHLRECESCQQELRELGPIASLLPRLYDDLDLPGLDPLPVDLDASASVRERIVAEAVTIGAAETVTEESVEVTELIGEAPTIEAIDASVEATVPDLEDPVIPSVASPAVDAAVAADEAAIAAQVAADEAAEEAGEAAADSTATPARRPRGRIAPGEAPPEANIVSLPKQRSSVLPWALAAAAAVIAIGSILWALAMMGQIDDLENERDFQDQQIAELNSEREEYLAQTSANVFPLLSTTSGTGDAKAMVYMDPDPNGWGGVVTFRGMSQPPSGQVYQLWMIEGDQALPGPTFMPDESGEAMVQVPGEGADSDAMAITMEPDGGSESPTTSPIMQGSLTA